MARCPECGGSLGPAWLFRVRSGATVRCRWCRAAVAVRRGFSIARDVGVILVGASGTTWFLLRWMDRGRDVDLLAAGLVPLLAVGAGWIAEFLAPLVTVEPRDLPHWARQPRPARDDAVPGKPPDRDSRRSVVG